MTTIVHRCARVTVHQEIVLKHVVGRVLLFAGKSVVQIARPDAAVKTR